MVGCSLINGILSFSNLTNIVGISQNIIDVMNKESHVGPIIFNCSTNGERSNLVAISLTALQALKTKQPVLASNNKTILCFPYNLKLTIQIINHN